MKLWLWLIFGLATVFICAITYYLTGFLVFAGRTASDFNRPLDPTCNDWHRNFTYADRRNPGDTSNIEIPNCDETRNLERISRYVENRDGLAIHYLSFPSQDSQPPETPIWLHVHGVTSSWLHGARYLQPSQRLGFRLLVIELQNHGKSARHKSGTSWGCQEKWDLIAVAELINKEFPLAPIFITATSMGTAVTTHALLESPETFTQVKALAYESPVSSPRFILQIWQNMRGYSQQTIDSLWSLVLSLTKLRSSVDFNQCFTNMEDHENTVDKPTLLQLSHEEHHNPEAQKQFSTYPKHSQVEVKIYPTGSHSAYWNYQPAEFEADLLQFWKKSIQEKKK